MTDSLTYRAYTGRKGRDMKYFTKAHTEHEPTQITKEQARHYLERSYVKEAVDEVIDNEKQFQLWTPYRVVWTMDENGLTPIAGFYGVCE